MERRAEELRGRRIIKALEEATGHDMPEWVLKELSRGDEEIDLVRSGLDDSMRLAFQGIREVKAENDLVTDYRTAAYVIAIEKIARSYIDIGVF
jgi:glutamate dehydrogenase (NAD(P)+)